MASWIDQIRQMLRRNSATQAAPAVQTTAPVTPAPEPAFDIEPNDPVLGYFAQANGVVDVERINIDSPAVRAMRAANVKMVVPLVNQGEVVALLNLGPRRSEQEYSRDDRSLLNALALQAAPAVRVAQLVREQQAEAVERERLQQEMNVARQIQLELLPKQDPDLPGYRLEKYYEPARAVGGDFYDFFELSDGQLVIIVGDVSGKGVPAALVMANTRSVLRGASRRLNAPGDALARGNDILTPEMPLNMFVTCLCAILDPATGRLRYANAGHNPPYVRHKDKVEELYARGMPLGLFTNQQYEELETQLEPGDCVLFYSDGLSEAHNAQGEMFGFGRLQSLMANQLSGHDTVDEMTNELRKFTGEDWEQEDDITMLVLERLRAGQSDPASSDGGSTANGRVMLASFSFPSHPGNERIAMNRVGLIAQQFGLQPPRLDGLKTAVAEATMNAIEYGNDEDPNRPVDVAVFHEGDTLIVRVSDRGQGTFIPSISKPNLEAKLAGEQSPRGWGLFLIDRLVDQVNFSRDPQTQHLTVEMVMNLTHPNSETAEMDGAGSATEQEGDQHP